ncbi:hypothetical protein V1525DRAFT_263004 [Lipomyces kononenkoae]|uniref:Uncharacterized protein n=1 Tax=Lipomyces kononenkoae TaxID=34357 RepID=A0ACC3T8A4_LIPKO
MLATDPSRSSATQAWVNSTAAPAGRPPSNRLPTTELTTDDRLRNAAASAAIVSTSASRTGIPATTTSGNRRKYNVGRQSQQGSAGEETRSGPTDLAAGSARTSLRQSGRYANPADLPSHPIVGVDRSCSNKAAVLAGNVHVESMWKPTGTSSTAATAAMLAHSSPKSPELWKPDPATSAGLAEILSKDPKYTITSQTGARPSRLSASATQKQYSPSQLHHGGHHTPPLSPKMEDAAGASRHAMANIPSTSQPRERYSPSAAAAARNAPPTPPSPVEAEESTALSRGAAGAALHRKQQPRQNYVESKSVPSTQVHSFAALEEAAKRAAAARLSQIGEPQPAYALSPSVAEKKTQRPVTALGGAEHATRMVQLEHLRQVSSRAAESDRYDAATRHEMLLAAAQRNVQSKLDAIDKEAASTTLFGNKEFNAMALALAEIGITGKYTANPYDAGRVDVGGGVYMSPEEVHGIAQQHVQPVLEDLDQKAFDQQVKDEMARQEKERIKSEKAAEKARKKEEKADKKKQKDAEKQTRKEQKEDEKRRKQEEKQRKKEEKEREKALSQEKKKEEKRLKGISKQPAGPAVQGAGEVTAAALVPPAAGGMAPAAGEVAAAGAPMPAVPTEHVQETEEVTRAAVAPVPQGPAEGPVYQAEPSGEGYETPVEECAATAAIAAPKPSYPESGFGAEGYETPVEVCPPATAAPVPHAAPRAEEYETPVEESTAAAEIPKPTRAETEAGADGNETPVQSPTAAAAEVAKPSYPDVEARGEETYTAPVEATAVPPAAPRAEEYETPIEETTTAAAKIPERTQAGTEVSAEGYETPIQGTTAAAAKAGSRAEGHETPIEATPIAPSAEEYEAPIEGSTATGAAKIPEPTHADTEVGAKGDGVPVQGSTADAAKPEEGKETPVDTYTGATGKPAAESGAGSHMTEAPEAGSDIEGGYEYVQREDIADETVEST